MTGATMDSARDTLATARLKLEAGELQPALTACEDVLIAQPEHLDALVLIGEILHRGGNHPAALGAFQRALGVRPGHGPAALGIARVFLGLDQPQEARQAIERALAVNLDNAPLLAFEGRLLQESDEPKAAAGAYRRALEAGLDTVAQRVDVLSGLGGVLSEQNDPAGAREAFERALAEDPGALAARCGLAELALAADDRDEAGRQFAQAAPMIDPATATDLLRRAALQLALLGRYDDAEAALTRVLAVRPDDLPALKMLGRVHREQGRDDDALACFRRSLEVDPEDIGALCDLGSALAMREPDEARPLLDKAYGIAPDDARVLFARGTFALEQGDPETSYELLGRAVDVIEAGEADPGVSEGLTRNNFANALSALGRRRDAYEMLKRAVVASPLSRMFRYNRGLCALAVGDWEAGWEDYDQRLHLKMHPPLGLPEPSAWGTALPPLWQGEELAGRSLLVLPEQGPGDMVMFGQCLIDLVARGASVELRVTQRLADLMRRSFPDVNVNAFATHLEAYNAPTDADLAAPIGCLPRWCRGREEDFTAPDRYLAGDPDAVAEWRARLDQDVGPGLRVGISWRGGAVLKERAHRKVPLAAWDGIASLDGVRLVSLQYGDRADDLAGFAEATGRSIADWPEMDPVKRIDDFAALVDALDMVISVANTTVHFAAALGKPVWALVPTSASWRWLTERDDCPWYPTMTLIRQAPGTGWEDVLAEVATRLRARLEQAG